MGYSTQEIINNNLRNYFDTMTKKEVNRIIVHKGNKPEHELAKSIIATQLILQGSSILTESKLKNGKRPDIAIIDVEPPICVEIMCSEKDESIEEKSTKYPGKIITIKTEAVKPIHEWLENYPLI